MKPRDSIAQRVDFSVVLSLSFSKSPPLQLLSKTLMQNFTLENP